MERVISQAQYDAEAELQRWLELYLIKQRSQYRRRYLAHLFKVPFRALCVTWPRLPEHEARLVLLDMAATGNAESFACYVAEICRQTKEKSDDRATRKSY